ncbi:MAG: hypothetical protein AAFO81_09125 [Pseudomonadota bacterium]
MPGAAPTQAVLVVGNWLNGQEASVMRRRLTDRYQINAHQISYRVARASLAQNITVLRDFVETEVRPRGDDVHFIAHGLGAVITLAMLAEWNDAPDGRVVCLGAPIGDSDATRRLAAASGDDGLMCQSLATFEMPWSALSARQIGAVAGTHSRSATDLPTQNDGCVGVDETRADALTDHLRLGAGHTQLLTSREVIDQVNHFMRHGAFDRTRKHLV